MWGGREVWREGNGGLEHAHETVAGSRSGMRVRSLTERMCDIDREMPIASDAQKDELTRGKMTLTAEVRRLNGQWWSFARRRTR